MSDFTLELDHLSKSFDAQAVLKDISAQVQPGEVIGLLGLNGAGKTTLLETSLGFSLPTGGAAAIFGQNSTTMDGPTKTRIGFVPQRDELLDGMKGNSYLALIAEFYPTWNHQLVARLSQEWAVPLDTRINKLSVGQRQKLSIISALGHEPDLIILDEPVASLDPVARRLFLKELVDIASSQTRTILFSTHIVSDLERVASRVWLMQEGRLSIDASMDELKENFVRIQLPAGQRLPDVIAGNAIMHTRTDSKGNTIVLLRDWSKYMSQGMHTLFSKDWQPEALTLEDLFLELHA
jgi:ABC-2 type transport system ATP-binding protein